MAIEPDIPGVDDPGVGRRMALDVGTVRIGVAVSDREAMLATPVETVARQTGFKDRDQGDIDRIIELINSYQVVEVVVGLPRDLQGNGSKSVKHAKEIAFRIRRRLRAQAGERVDKTADGGRDAIPVRMADERLTTVVATQALRSSGISEKKGRRVIDQAAAVEILQSWLDSRSRRLEQDNVQEAKNLTPGNEEK